jgi:hypothetical protein
MAIERVMQYKTSDNKYFDTEEEAIDWEARGSLIASLSKHIIQKANVLTYTSDAIELATWFVDNYNFERKAQNV